MPTNPTPLGVPTLVITLGDPEPELMTFDTSEQLDHHMLRRFFAHVAEQCVDAEQFTARVGIVLTAMTDDFADDWYATPRMPPDEEPPIANNNRTDRVYPR